MSNWTCYNDIKIRLNKIWNKGDILRSTQECDNIFPLKIKLKTPTASEMCNQFVEIGKWIQSLKTQDKHVKGYGYILEEKTVNYRLVGKNTLPTHAVIPTILDAVKIISKKSDYDLYIENKNLILDNFPTLKEWVHKYPFKVINKIGEEPLSFIKVLKWFKSHPNHYMYIREFDIQGVDTKFIEKNKVIIAEMLDIILPNLDVNSNERNFEKRFNIKSKPSLIRFRILDENMYTIFSDITVNIEEFNNWNPDFENVFFTENEINFLSFPSVEKSCIVFSKGYGVELLRNAEWLKELKTYYWGDIDTHGFNILSIARGFLPNLESFLMNEEILVKHKNLWGIEEKQFLGSIKNLTSSERDLVDKLQNDYFGVGVRLEQERIKFSYIEEYLETIT